MCTQPIRTHPWSVEDHARNGKTALTFKFLQSCRQGTHHAFLSWREMPVASVGPALQTCFSEDDPYLTSRCLLDAVAESSLTLFPVWVVTLSGDLFSGSMCYSSVDKSPLPSSFTYSWLSPSLWSWIGNPIGDRWVNCLSSFPIHHGKS